MLGTRARDVRSLCEAGVDWRRAGAAMRRELAHGGIHPVVVTVSTRPTSKRKTQRANPVAVAAAAAFSRARCQWSRSRGEYAGAAVLTLMGMLLCRQKKVAGVLKGIMDFVC